MRGVIERFDGADGVIRSDSGTLYLFNRAALVRRSKPPIMGARVVFRPKNGAVHKAAVGPDRSEAPWYWDSILWPLEILLYLP